MMDRLSAAGDHETVEALEVILEEEVRHVAIGTKWFRYCCRQRGLESLPTFLQLLRERYDSLPRGPFNLANLPVLCDRSGPFGSPTSDSARTMVTADCRETLLVLYGFGAAEGLDPALVAAAEALQRYCDGEVTARWQVAP